MSSSEVGAPTAGRSNYFNSNAGLEPAWSRVGAVLEPCWSRVGAGSARSPNHLPLLHSPPTPPREPTPNSTSTPTTASSTTTTTLALL